MINMSKKGVSKNEKVENKKNIIILSILTPHFLRMRVNQNPPGKSSSHQT